MLAGVRECLDNNDVIGLRYIFVDSLDVDPTFETYEDDYEVCCRRDGFFEPHAEMTPFCSHSGWDMDYWDQIKIDLSNNFSKTRFEHMIEVAKVVYADKIVRLRQERSAETRTATKPTIAAAPPAAPSPMPVVSSAPRSDHEEEQAARKLAEKQCHLKDEKRKFKAQWQTDEVRCNVQKQQQNSSHPTGEPNSKNWLGVAVGVTVVVAIVGVGIALLLAL